MTTLRKSLVIASVLSVLFMEKAQAQFSFVNVNSQFVKKSVSGIAVDPGGNVIFAGNFDTTITIGGVTLVNSFPTGFDVVGNDAYFAKLTPAGTYAWVKKIGINSVVAKKSCSPYKGVVWKVNVSTDASGNIYLTGMFRGSVSFDAITVVSTTSQGGGCPSYSWDMFTAKMSPSGSFVWVKTEGTGSFTDEALSSTTDASGNVYISGTQSDVADMYNPVCSLYVAKYNSTGTKQWEKKYGSSVFVTNRVARGVNIITDGTYSYIAGSFTGTINFGGGNTFNVGTATSTVVLKLDGSGNTVWAKAYSKSSPGNLLLDNGNVDLYLACTIDDTAVFGATTLIESNSYGNPALIKCSSSTGVPLWAVITGYAGSGAAFKHPSGATGVLANDAGQYFAIKEFDTSGVQLNATVATSDTIFSTSARVAGYPNGFAYVQSLRGTYTLGGITMGTKPYAPGSSYRDMGVVRYTAPPPPQSASLGINNFGNQQVDVYPNPVQGWLHIGDKNGLGRIEVCDLTGRLLLSKYSNSITLELDLSPLPSGIYLVKAEHWARPIKIQKL